MASTPPQSTPPPPDSPQSFPLSSASQSAAADAACALYHQIDNARRWQGRLFDAMGLAPQETPSHVTLATPLFTLKAYHDPGATGPVLVLVPAPIKRAYVWDIEPQESVVRACLERGARVYLVEWEAPDASQQQIGLAGYADHALSICIDAILAESGRQPVIMLGHSLGGTLAAIFAALHSDRLAGLVLLGAPLHFGADAGAFAPALAATPPGTDLPTGMGNPAGSFLTAASVLAAPQTFIGDRWLDLLSSVADPAALRTHLLVERWTLDEVPIPRQLFNEVLDLLYREDCLTEGTLLVADQPVTPAQLTVPLLNVIEEKSRIVPPSAVLPFHEASGSSDRSILWYGGDVGVGLQHVGMLVGRNAHGVLWPEILDWCFDHAGALARH